MGVAKGAHSVFLVRLLREELQLLQEQGSHVGEVIKTMDKKKVLVKVGFAKRSRRGRREEKDGKLSEGEGGRREGEGRGWQTKQEEKVFFSKDNIW